MDPANREPGDSRDRSVDGSFVELYARLRAIAANEVSRRPAGYTLRATEVVNVAFVKLKGWAPPELGREQVLAAAAKAIRQVVIDHDRSRSALKRGRSRRDQRDAKDVPDPHSARSMSSIELDELLLKLEKLAPECAKAAEMKYFGGMTNPEIALATGTARSTVAEKLAFAKAWLRVECGGSAA